MNTKNKGLIIGIGFAVIVTAIVIWQIIDFPKTLKEAKQAANTSLSLTNETVIANIHVPAAGDAGKFIGKLEKLALEPKDVSTATTTYGVSTISGGGFYQKDFAYAPEDKDSTQRYIATPIDNFDQSTNNKIPTSSIRVTMQTFKDTSSAAHFYATTKQSASIFKDISANLNIDSDPKNYHTTEGVLTNVGDDNYYSASGYDPSSDPAVAVYATKNWGVTVLMSNMIASWSITLPYTAPVSDVQNIMDAWMKKVAAYVPGTAADIQTENATAK